MATSRTYVSPCNSALRLRRWWALRLSRAKLVYDITRIDHFRGVAAYWAVDAKETTAIKVRTVCL